MKHAFKISIIAFIIVVFAYLFANPNQDKQKNTKEIENKQQIAFSSDRGFTNKWKLYLMDADGSNVKKLSDKTANMGGWSPDGSKLAFGYEKKPPLLHFSGDDDICVIDIKSGEVKNLTNSKKYSGFPDWSPDGKYIVFQSNRRSGNRVSGDNIYIMDADGSNLKKLTSGDNDYFEPQWSPDGKKILFGYNNSDGDSKIGVMDADGSHQKDLTNKPVNVERARDMNPAWSPDGSKIAFISLRDNPIGEIYTMNPDGSNVKKLTNNGKNGDHALNEHFDWSPDGKSIAFVSDRDGNKEIYVVDIAEAKEKRLTNNRDIDIYPVWSPDGEKIAFVSHRDGNYEIYVMNVDGSNQKRLTNGEGSNASPAWRPKK